MYKFWSTLVFSLGLLLLAAIDGCANGSSSAVATPADSSLAAPVPVPSATPSAFNYTGTWSLTGITGQNPYSTSPPTQVACNDTTVTMTQTGGTVTVGSRTLTCHKLDAYNTPLSPLTITEGTFPITGSNALYWSDCRNSGHCLSFQVDPEAGEQFSYDERCSLFGGCDYIFAGTLQKN